MCVYLQSSQHFQVQDQGTQTEPIRGCCTACGYTVRDNPLVKAGEITGNLGDILVDIPEVHKRKKVRFSAAKFARIMTSQEAQDARATVLAEKENKEKEKEQRKMQMEKNKEERERKKEEIKKRQEERKAKAEEKRRIKRLGMTNIVRKCRS